MKIAIIFKIYFIINFMHNFQKLNKIKIFSFSVNFLKPITHLVFNEEAHVEQ